MRILRAYIVYIDHTINSICFLETSGRLRKTTNPRSGTGRGLQRAQDWASALLRLRLLFLIVFFILQALVIIYFVTDGRNYIAFGFFAFSKSALNVINHVSRIRQLAKLM